MKSSYWILIVLMLLTACSKKGTIDDVPKIVIGYANIDTKSTLNDDLSFSWKKGDKILLAYLNGPHPGWSYAYEYVFIAESDGIKVPFSYSGYYLLAGSKHYAEFPGFGEGQEYSVVYRTHSVGSLELYSAYNSYLTCSVPPAQNYCEGNKYGLADDMFECVGFVDGSSSYPVDNILLYHLYAVIKVRITAPNDYNVTVSSISITSPEGGQQGISGKMGLISLSGAPFIPLVSVNEEKFINVWGPFSLATKNITLDCNNTSICKGESKDFGIVVIPCMTSAGGYYGTTMTFSIDYKVNDISQPKVIMKKKISVRTIKPGKVYTINKTIAAPMSVDSNVSIEWLDDNVVDF